MLIKGTRVDCPVPVEVELRQENKYLNKDFENLYPCQVYYSTKHIDTHLALVIIRENRSN